MVVYYLTNTHPAETFSLPIYSTGRPHYGNPKSGCRDDEDPIEAGTGRVCAPKVGDRVGRLLGVWQVIYLIVIPRSV